MNNFIKILSLAVLMLVAPSLAGAKNKPYNVVDTTDIKNMENKNKKLDLEYFKEHKDDRGDLIFVRENGTKIWQFEGWECYVEEETPPSPKLYMIQRKYYLNGNLKSEGILLPGGLPVSIWRTYDEQGNVTEEDMDKRYGAFDYNKVILFLAKKGHIDIKTGRGREDFTIGVDEEKHCWDITIWPRERNNYKGFEYLLDIDTGKIKKQGKVLPSGS